MRPILGAVVLAALVAAPAVAQSKPQTRDGFTISFGLGGGSAGSSCDGCHNDRESAPSVYLRLGGALRPGLVLAGEINGWSKTKTELGVEGTLTIVTVNALVQWYPVPANGFFVSGGVGAGTMALDVKAPGRAEFFAHPVWHLLRYSRRQAGQHRRKDRRQRLSPRAGLHLALG